MWSAIKLRSMTFFLRLTIHTRVMRQVTTRAQDNVDRMSKICVSEDVWPPRHTRPSPRPTVGLASAEISFQPLVAE